MIVSSTSGKSWILPKGHPEDDLKNSQVASLESYEEAGIKGIIFDKKLGKEFKQKKEGLNLLIYPLLITKVLSKWKEESIRKRQLVTIDKALDLVTKKEHLYAIKYFSSDAMVNKFFKAVEKQ